MKKLKLKTTVYPSGSVYPYSGMKRPINSIAFNLWCLGIRNQVEGIRYEELKKEVV